MPSSNQPPELDPREGSIGFGLEARRLWALDPDLLFLNHGSFGAVPIPILERAAEMRRELEGNPVREVWRQGLPAVRLAATAIAEFVGSEPSRTAL